MAALGGYVLSSTDLEDTIDNNDDKRNGNDGHNSDRKGEDRRDGERRWPVHRLPFGGVLYQWLGNHWQVLAQFTITVLFVLFCIFFVLFFLYYVN